MNVKQPDSVAWTELGDCLECQMDDGAFEENFDDPITLRLRVDEVLEEFESRRVLVASAQEIVDDQKGELSDAIRNALLHPTYLVEESKRTEEPDRDWPDEVSDLIRLPVTVENVEGIRRSVFVDNVGISVGDLVDLVRGELKFNQIESVFFAVGELFEKLHDAGWVHLGLTPWNVRVFDSDKSDSFLQAFLSDTFSADDPSLKEALEKWNDEDEAEQDGDESSADVDIDSSFTGREKTLMELEPLGGGSDAGTEAGQEDTEVDDTAQRSGDGEVPDEAGEDSEDSEEHGADDADEEADQEQDDELDEAEEELIERGGPGLAGSSFYDSEVSWSEIAGETSAVEVNPVEVATLEAILDGIDRLFPAGRVKDEVAVTPGFSAPELLSGLGTNDGETADVFSLGMFLYFLVAGVVPPASVYTRYTPAIPTRNFRPDFPPGLQTVISRATRPRPEDRYASVTTLMEAFADACDTMRERDRVRIARPPTVTVASDTHIGIAKRRSNPTNQDSVFSASSDDRRFSLVVVADGVSTASYGSGDLASTALAEEAEKVWADILPTYLMEEEFDEFEIIAEIFNRANRRIVEHVNEHFTPFRGSPHEVMGSTALVALIVDGVVTLASLGDSRVYLQRGAGMEQLTIDHNLWTLSILEGVDADAALSMPHGDALARCLGTFVVEEQRLREVSPTPDLFRFRIMKDDTLLMTTDGLVDFAGTNQLAAEDNILAILLAEPDPALACLELILLANRGGGGDNIGLSVIRTS